MSALADRRWEQTMQPLGPGDPRQVGPYRIRARLGAGGMGQVFLGYSPAGRAVAVKVIHRELARDPAFRTRFRREVAAARAVSGAYTAPVTAAGPDDDPPWLATVFVPGPTLAAAVAKPARCPRRRCGSWPPAWSRRCRRCIPAGWCTGTSSRATCCWPSTGRG